MANQLLTFNPAFMRRRGGDEPTGTEPLNLGAVQRFVLTRTQVDAVHLGAVQRFVLVRSS